MARGAIEDGHWLTPFVYGQRFAERPGLLSWIAALFGKTAGGVTLWSLRIPHLFIALDELARMDTPATAVLLPEEFGALSGQNPTMQFVVGQELVSLKQPYRIVEIYPIDAAH